MEARDKSNPLRSLTLRELQTLELIAEGRAYSDIAEALGVSYKTVVNTSSLLKKKLGARSLPELIYWYTAPAINNRDQGDIANFQQTICSPKSRADWPDYFEADWASGRPSDELGSNEILLGLGVTRGAR